MTRLLNNPRIDFKKDNNTIALIIDKKKKFMFNRTIKIGNGSILAVDIPPIKENMNTIIEYNDLHNKLGHPNDEIVKTTAQKLGIKYKGQRIMFDISSIRAISQGGNKFWLLIMDEFTNYCWSYFLRNKNDLSEILIEWILNFNDQYKKQVKIIRCDNAGENYNFMKDVKKNISYHINFEFTAPNTP